MPSQAATVADLPWYCVVCGANGLADFLHNVILFLPLGLAARRIGWSWQRNAATWFMLSVAIEVIQGTVLVGRDAALGDVLANGSGAMLGWISLPLLGVTRRPTPRQARIGAGLLAVTTSLIVILTPITFRPALGGTGPWTVEITPASPFTEAFAGTVSRVIVNGMEITAGSSRAAPRSQGALDVQLDLTRLAAQRAARPAVLVRIKDARGDVQLHVSQLGDALVVETRLTGSSWRLSSPGWRFDHAADTPIGQRWTLHWVLTDGRMTLQSGPANGLTGPSDFTRVASVASGWVFIHPFVVTLGPDERLWTALWLLFWFALTGWFAGHLAGPARWGFGVSMLVVIVATTAVARYALPVIVPVVATAAYAVAATGGRRQTIGDARSRSFRPVS